VLNLPDFGGVELPSLADLDIAREASNLMLQGVPELEILAAQPFYFGFQQEDPPEKAHNDKAHDGNNHANLLVSRL